MAKLSAATDELMHLFACKREIALVALIIFKVA